MHVDVHVVADVDIHVDADVHVCAYVISLDAIVEPSLTMKTHSAPAHKSWTTALEGAAFL